MATGRFEISNGSIFNPDGGLFVMAGINVGGNLANNPDIVDKLFPDLNTIRIAVDFTQTSPQAWDSFIKYFEARKKLCIPESHAWPLVPAFSGQSLNNLAGLYAQWATHFKGFKYLALGSPNEPQGGDMSNEQAVIYKAVRDAGSDCLIAFEAGAGGGNPGQTGPAALNAATYKSMTRCFLDLHFYGWIFGSGTEASQDTVNAKLLGARDTGTGILSAQQITSADGIMPVWNGETGPCTSDQIGFDKSATEVTTAVIDWAWVNGHSCGFTSWHWDADRYNALQTNNNARSAWGDRVNAAHVKIKNYLVQKNSGVVVTPRPTPAPSTVTPNNTLLTGAGAKIIDTNGNVWLITADNQITINGDLDASTANVQALAYKDGAVWQKNADNMWWEKSIPTDNWAPDAGTPTAPVTATAPPTSPPVTPAPTTDNKTSPAAVNNPTKGNWLAKQVKVGVKLKSGVTMYYSLLPPPDYDANKGKYKYALMVHMHELNEGTRRYQDKNAGDYISNDSQGDKWYNDPAWRGAYNCFVALPYCDETSDTSGQNSNFGGYDDTPGSDPNQRGVIDVVKEICSEYSIDPARIYPTGNSLGAIGTEAMMLDYNSINGPVEKIFAAGLAYSGKVARAGGLTQDIITRLRSVPLFAISGAQDTTCRPADFNDPLWTALAGNSQFPTQVPGATAGNSKFRYLRMPNLSHDTWDSLRPFAAGKFAYDWLFSQTATGSTIPVSTTAPSKASPNNTLIHGATGKITDNAGNEWAINSDGKITVNGTADASTANVTDIALVNDLIWQQNSAKLWWSKSAPSSAWTPGNGTSTPPITAPSVTQPPVTPAPTGSNSKAEILGQIATIRTTLTALEAAVNTLT